MTPLTSIPLASEELAPLVPHPAEIAMSVIGATTIVFCLFVCVQLVRGRVTAGPGLGLIVMALLLPVVGPLLGCWLLLRTRRRSAVPAVPSPAPAHEAAGPP